MHSFNWFTNHESNLNKTNKSNRTSFKAVLIYFLEVNIKILTETGGTEQLFRLDVSKKDLQKVLDSSLYRFVGEEDKNQNG